MTYYEQKCVDLTNEVSRLRKRAIKAESERDAALDRERRAENELTSLRAQIFSLTKAVVPDLEGQVAKLQASASALAASLAELVAVREKFVGLSSTGADGRYTRAREALALWRNP